MADHIEDEATYDGPDDAQDMSRSAPSPPRLTIMLPIQPATSPTTSQAIMDIPTPFCFQVTV